MDKKQPTKVILAKQELPAIEDPKPWPWPLMNPWGPHTGYLKMRT